MAKDEVEEEVPGRDQNCGGRRKRMGSALTKWRYQRISDNETEQKEIGLGRKD